MTTIIGKKYNLNFVSDFDSSDIIINFSMYMHANQVILYLFERWEHALILESKIIWIGLLDAEILAFKPKSLK